MTFPVEHVLAGLHRLRADDSKSSLAFGAKSHGYRLEPVLDERTVAEFESMHGIVLPRTTGRSLRA